MRVRKIDEQLDATIRPSRPIAPEWQIHALTTVPTFRSKACQSHALAASWRFKSNVIRLLLSAS